MRPGVVRDRVTRAGRDIIGPDILVRRFWVDPHHCDLAAVRRKMRLEEKPRLSDSLYHLALPIEYRELPELGRRHRHDHQLSIPADIASGRPDRIRDAEENFGFSKYRRRRTANGNGHDAAIRRQIIQFLT